MGRIILADALEGLRLLEAGSCRTCVTSPPYYGLRDYGTPGQIGLEATPEEYIARLVEVFREVRRVLADDGTLWINIADTYAGSYAGHGDTRTTNRANHAARVDKPCITPSGMKPKDLMGIPWMLAFALRADGWYLRQEIIWAKPNPMPESVTDRCTKAHESLFLLSKQPRYYFDASAIAEPVAESTVKRLAQDVDAQAGSTRVPGKTNGPMKAVPPRYGGNKYTATPEVFNRTKSGNAYVFRDMRNKRDVWTVATQPFKEAHFATFPPDLIRPCILAGSAKGDTVLDPFFGSGTTGVVTFEECRDFVGIDNNPDYVALAERRTAEAMTQGRYENTLIDFMR